MAIIEIDEEKYEVPHQVAALLQAVSKERDELEDFAKWMTGWGCDLSQFNDFHKKKAGLLRLRKKKSVPVHFSK